MVPLQVVAVCPARLSLAALANPDEPTTQQTQPSAVRARPDPTSNRPPNRTIPTMTRSRGLRFSSNPSEAELCALHVFREPLLPVGGAATSASENKALANVIQWFVEKGDAENTDGLTNFLNQFPGSSWSASLLAEFGSHLALDGPLVKGTRCLGRSLAALEGRNRPKGSALADYVLGELAQLNARLGRADRLESSILGN